MSKHKEEELTHPGSVNEGVWQAWKTESLLYKYFLHPSSPLRLGGVRSTGAAFSTQTNGACYWMRQAVKAWSKLLWSEQRADHPGRKQWPTVDGTAASYSSCLGCCTHWYCVHTRTYYEIKKHVDLLMPSCWEVTSATGWEGRETCTPPDGDSSLPPLEPSLQLLPSESYQLRICVCACVCLRFGRCEHVFESIKVAEMCEFIHAGVRLIVRMHMYTFVCIYKSRCVPACAFVCVCACVYSAAQALPIQPPSPRLELK